VRVRTIIGACVLAASRSPAGDKVTRYRAGRLPEVEWVEGCS
jgi:hypothetical protein